MASNADSQLDDIVGAIQASKNAQATHDPAPAYRDPKLGSRFWNSLMGQWQGLDDATGDTASMIDLEPTDPATKEPAFRRHRGADPLITATAKFHEPAISLGLRTLPEQLKSTFEGDFLGENASPDLQRLNEIERRTQEHAGLDAPQGLAENLASTGGMLAGQLPVPGDLLSQGVSKLPTAARLALKAPAAVADFFGPTFHPSIQNLASGSAAGVGIQKGMDAWLEHQQGKKDAKWGPVEEAQDRYHQDLFKRAREGKITRQEAEYLLNMLDTSGSGEDRLDDSDPNEVPPVTQKFAKGGKVRKAKGGKFKLPTAEAKLGLRQKLQDLMSDANVAGTGKELVPLPNVDPAETPALTNLPDAEFDREPAPTNLMDTPVSRRDVLKGMASLASPVKLDPMSYLLEDHGALGAAEGNAAQAAFEKSLTPEATMGVIARMNDGEGYERSAWGHTAAAAYRSLVNHLAEGLDEGKGEFEDPHQLANLMDEHGVDYQKGSEADAYGSGDDESDSIMTWIRGEMKQHPYETLPDDFHDKFIHEQLDPEIFPDELERKSIFDSVKQRIKEHRENALVHDPEGLDETPATAEVFKHIKDEGLTEDRLEYRMDDLKKAYPQLSWGEIFDLWALIQHEG